MLCMVILRGRPYSNGVWRSRYVLPHGIRSVMDILGTAWSRMTYHDRFEFDPVPRATLSWVSIASFVTVPGLFLLFSISNKERGVVQVAVEKFDGVEIWPPWWNSINLILWQLLWPYHNVTSDWMNVFTCVTDELCSYLRVHVQYSRSTVVIIIHKPLNRCVSPNYHWMLSDIN